MILGYAINSGEQPKKIFCDTAADVSGLAEYAEENGLVMGSECLCIATGKRFILDSTGAWIEQP